MAASRSFDYHWIISPHPSSDGHLFIATAGSGHTFKNLPNVGLPVALSLYQGSPGRRAGRQVRRRLHRGQAFRRASRSLAVRHFLIPRVEPQCLT